MKKSILIIAVAFLTTISASSQIVTSRTLVKSKTETMWYARAGVSINTLALSPSDFSDKFSVGSKAAFALDLGFQRNIGKSGVYWGMELGLSSRGASFGISDEYKDEYDKDELDSYKASYSAWGLKFSPFTIGYKYSITDDIKIDGHLGGFVSYDFSKKFKGDNVDDDIFDDYQNFDAGLQVGIGVWWKKFNLDFMYQRGFIDNNIQYYRSFNNLLCDVDSSCSSNFAIRLGYSF